MPIVSHVTGLLCVKRKDVSAPWKLILAWIWGIDVTYGGVLTVNGVARLVTAPKVEVKRTARVTAAVANFMALCDLRDGYKRERDFSAFLEWTTKGKWAGTFYTNIFGVLTPLP
jgi:hypothetical protein